VDWNKNYYYWRVVWSDFNYAYSTPSNRQSFTSLPCDLHDDATCTIHCRSSANFEAKLGNPSLNYFEMNQANRCRRMSSHRLHPPNGFEAQPDKPPPTWFWDPNQKTVTVILRPKSPNRRPWFWGPNQETVVVVWRPNHWLTFTTGFEDKPGNPHFSSSPRAWCGSHTVPPDLPIIRPLTTWLVPDHPWSSAPSVLLLHRSSLFPAMSYSAHAHHETSKRVSPHQIT
jgi:hypothetical protein